MAGLDWAVMAYATLVVTTLFVGAEIMFIGPRAGVLVRFLLCLCVAEGILVLSRAAAVESRELARAGFALLGLAGLVMLAEVLDALLRKRRLGPDDLFWSSPAGQALLRKHEAGDAGTARPPVAETPPVSAVRAEEPVFFR